MEYQFIRDQLLELLQVPEIQIGVTLTMSFNKAIVNWEVHYNRVRQSYEGQPQRPDWVKPYFDANVKPTVNLSKEHIFALLDFVDRFHMVFLPILPLINADKSKAVASGHPIGPMMNQYVDYIHAMCYTLASAGHSTVSVVATVHLVHLCRKYLFPELERIHDAFIQSIKTVDTEFYALIMDEAPKPDDTPK